MTNLTGDMAETAHIRDGSSPELQAPKRRWRRGLRTATFHTSASILAFAWFLPILFILITAFRSFDDLAGNGVASLPTSFDPGNFATAWNEAGMYQAMINSMIVTVPTVILTLALSASAAFGLSRYRIPFRRTILLIMLAGNLLPTQMILIPVSRIAQQLGIFDTLFALIAIQVAFGIGFYTFVLYGFMRSIPNELQEAAALDGAGVIRTFVQVILPLTRPALAALAALSFTWVFNELLWSITLLQTSSKLPVTAAVLSLKGLYTSSYSIIAAATVIAAIPCVIVFMLFQRSFLSGLALGSVK